MSYSSPHSPFRCCHWSIKLYDLAQLENITPARQTDITYFHRTAFGARKSVLTVSFSLPGHQIRLRCCKRGSTSLHTDWSSS
jgi:hypothetical protein